MLAEVVNAMVVASSSSSILVAMLDTLAFGIAWRCPRNGNVSDLAHTAGAMGFLCGLGLDDRPVDGI